MMSQKIAILVSNGLTIATIILSLSVVFLWFPAAREAFRERQKKPWESEEWFIIGVFLGFIGEALDNTYWLLPWSAEFLNLPETQALIATGVWVNIPFRQIFSSVAAYCHIRSALSYHKKHDRRADHIVIYAAVAGLIYSVIIAGRLWG